MKTPLIAVAATLLFSVATLADAPKPNATVLKPVKVSALDAHGPVFKSKSAVTDNGPDGPAIDVPMLKSRDGHFTAGLYSAGPSDVPIESYGEDEFMYFLEGSVKLTSADGSVLEIKAGEGATIPKGWKGRWTTSGYKKYYVTYEGGK